MNHTIKKTLAKIYQETHLKWDQAFIALLQIRVAPRSGLKLSPFEIVYRRPFQISVLGMLPLDLEHEPKIKSCAIFRASTNYIAQACSLQFCLPIWWALTPVPAGGPSLTKPWKTQSPEQQLAKQWSSSYDILRTTHSSLKLTGIRSWIHHTQIKQAPPEVNLNPAMVDAENENYMKDSGRRFEISFSQEDSGPQCKMTISITLFMCLQI